VFSPIAALVLSCTCQRPGPPPAAPVPEVAPGVSQPAPPSALRDPAPSFSIALLPLHPPASDLKVTVAEIAAQVFPHLKIQSPGEPLGSLPVAIVGTYQSPGIGAEELSGTDRSLSPELRAVLSKPLKATALEFHVAGTDALASLQHAQDLASALVAKVDGAMMDGETHELFGPSSWKRFRVAGWSEDGLPAVTTQITFHRNGGDETAPRLVSFGMVKFGLPDVAAVDRPGASPLPLSTRLHLICQLLVEGQAPADDGKMTLDASKVRERSGRQALIDAGAKAPFDVQLRKASPQPGDPDNRILELVAPSGGDH